MLKKHQSLNARLARGERLGFDLATGEATGLDGGGPGAAELRAPVLGVYHGAGASHSWLWYVDVLENLGFFHIRFLGEKDVRGGGLAGLDALLLSGGETFALGRGLGVEGRKRVVDFVRRGGLYLGSCAGACLLLSSTRGALDLMNVTDIKIANLTDEPPPPPVKESTKYQSEFGCAWVFHPVREEVLLSPTGEAPLFRKKPFTAPLYGGPPMEDSTDARPLAFYESFTENTDYLASREVAEKTLLGKVALYAKPHGAGLFVLSGPHLEHPAFPEANAVLGDMLFYGAASRGGERPEPARGGGTAKPVNNNRKTLEALAGIVSNARIQALALERRPASWKIGRKYYEPEKIRAFLEALWKRISPLRKRELGGDGAVLEKSLEEGREILPRLKTLRLSTEEGSGADEAAGRLFEALQATAAAFFTFYFGGGVHRGGNVVDNLKTA